MKKHATRTSFSALVIAPIAAFILLAPILLCPPATAVADSDKRVAIAPVVAETSVTYGYFDNPVDVAADASGITVTGDKLYHVDYATRSVTETLPVSARRAARHGRLLFTVEDGLLNCYNGSDVQSYSDNTVADFCISGEMLYALAQNKLVIFTFGEDGSFDAAEFKEIYLKSDIYAPPCALAAAGGNVYVVTNSAFSNKQDVCYVDENGALVPVLIQSDTVLSVAAMPVGNDEIVYLLTRDKITGYAVVGNGLSLKYSVSDGRMCRIAAYDGFIYGLDTLDALYKIPADLDRNGFTPIIASANDSRGFFNTPSAAYTKNSTLFVADTANDRVVAYGEDWGVSDGKYTRPVSVACDSSGTLYVAHSYNKITVTTRDGVTEFTVDGAIRQIAVNTDKQLFIDASDGLWLYQGGNAKKIGKPYKAITISAGKDELFGLTDESVQKLIYADETLTESTYAPAPSDALSLCVDLDGNAFILSPDRITRTDKLGNTSTFALSLEQSDYTLGGGGQILLGSIGNKYVEYGCAVIVDTYKHRVFTADGSKQTGLGIKLVDGDYEVPDDKNNAPADFGDGLVRTALYDTALFAIPAETPAVYTIAAGRKVIVPQYTLEDSREYSLVYIDDIANGKLIQGYVYKDSLSDPLPYVDPSDSACSVFTNATPIYKYPSPNAVALRDLANVKQGVDFTVLPFVSPYRDDYNNLWYRVKVDGGEGFVLARNVSLGSYEPTFERPAYNAKIISVEDSEYAPVYLLVGDKYVPQEGESLKTGTRVEVIGVFDTTERYTQVKYLDSERGTLTCYVPTEYIKYEGVNIVLIVAIIVIIVTVILAAVIIARVTYVNKHRITTNPAQKTNDEFEERT